MLLRDLYLITCITIISNGFVLQDKLVMKLGKNASEDDGDKDDKKQTHKQVTVTVEESNLGKSIILHFQKHLHFVLYHYNDF